MAPLYSPTAPSHHSYSKSWLSWAQFLYNSNGGTYAPGSTGVVGTPLASPAKGSISTTTSGAYPGGTAEEANMLCVCILKVRTALLFLSLLSYYYHGGDQDHTNHQPYTHHHSSFSPPPLSPSHALTTLRRLPSAELKPRGICW